MRVKTTTIKLTETQLRDLKHTLQQAIWMAQDSKKSQDFIETIKRTLALVQEQTAQDK